MAARDFTVTISAALDGDTAGEEKFMDDPKPPLEGLTVSDAGILRAPPDGEDPSRKRSVADLSAARATMKSNARYRVARAVAGQLARNVSDLLERDHVIDEARSLVPTKAEPIQLTTDLWLPARFSIEGILTRMSAPARTAYRDAPSDDKLVAACVEYVHREVEKMYQADAKDPDALRQYTKTLELVVDRILRMALPSQVTGADLHDLIEYLQIMTMVEIGQTGVVPRGFYENLESSIELRGITKDTVASSNQIPDILDKWDKEHNKAAIKRKRDEVEQINRARLDYIPAADRRRGDGSDSYPKGLAQLPETSQRVMFSPALSSALSKALDAVRRGFGVSASRLGTTDAVEFVSEFCSESMVLVFVEITACYIRIAELATPRRQESIKDNLPAINIQLSQAFSRLKEQFVVGSVAHPSPRPYYLMRGEGLPERLNQDEEAVVDDPTLGVPLVGAGTKRQKSGRLKTGMQKAQEVYNRHLLRRYAGVN